MKKSSLFFALFLFLNIFGQEKKNFTNTESLLKGIQPDKSITSWQLISNEYSRSSLVKSYGNKIDFLPQTSGFQLIENPDQYYFIAYNKNGKTSYVTDKTELKNFIGKIDNAEEAAIIALFSGYFLDEEFLNLAGNYRQTPDSYIVELAKISSQKCPLSKSHYEISVNKKSGEITLVKDNGNYSEVYDKTCENNPHYSALQKQIDDAKAKKAQDVIDNKEAKAKAKIKLMKSMKSR